MDLYIQLAAFGIVTSRRIDSYIQLAAFEKVPDLMSR